jgi:dipeptidyl aminopeptidase/acylaminoacyl peptidase
VVAQILSLATPSFAQTPTPEVTSRTPWSVDDILLAESAGDFQISPDNAWVVWVRSAMDEKEGRRASNLWITRVTDGESWPLTRGRNVNRSPRWSADGRLIAFLSTRSFPDSSDEGAGSQLWLLRIAGGEPWPLTTDVRALRTFAWKGSRSDTIVFAAQETQSNLERERKRKKDSTVAVEDSLEAPPVRLWTIAIDGKTIRRITDNDDWIEAMALSPDGRWAVTRHQVSLSYEFDQRQHPETHLVDLTSGSREHILAGTRTIPQRVEWAPDGSGFYFAYEYSTHPRYLMASVTRMGFYDVAADTLRSIDLEWERGVGAPGFEVLPSGFVAHLADGVQFRPARYTRRRDAWRREMLEGRHVGHVTTMEVSADGRLVAYVTSSANTPPQPYIGHLHDVRIRDERQVVTLNASFADKPKPQVEIIRWPGARNEEVEGILFYPLDYQPGRPYPLIVSIHGGPAAADLDAWRQRWSYPTVLFNQRGAFVLQPNYHGSGNYGLEWVESISDGRYYSLEIPDIESGVDQLITRGLVHPESIATHGWSNGAILSTELTTRNPDRYQASSAGAGDVEWISDWGNVDFGAAFDNYYFGSSPLQDPQRYMELSPFFRLDQVRTPTLIFFGTEDRNVPPSQGWSHYRALQQLGNTDVRLVLFPGEPHGLRKLAHQRRKIEEELAWYDRYLWGRADSTNLAMAEASPLARLLARRGARRVDGRYGVRVGGVLAPETVRRGAIEIGRFEVTRAQWREFDPRFVVPPGYENHPANGVDFERAMEYARWLSERTGHTYRLPTEAELRPLAGAPSGGVTLDYWAGYSPNPEDAERLMAAAAQLPEPAPLLREVGSIAADVTSDEPHIYDLGGNVAEWTVAADGSGALVGRSADRPKDLSAGRGEPRTAYRGLRVVREP